jgi:hypothetical protein
MGCAKCKQKKQGLKDNVDFNEVKGEVDQIIEDDNPNGRAMDALKQFKPDGFFIRIITFLALIVAIPLIAVYVICFLFFNFFLPTKNDMTISLNRLMKVIVYPFDIWRKFRRKLKSKSREKEFNKNRDYSDGSELLKNETYTKEYEGKEELDGIELVEKEDNNKNEK